MPMCHTSCRRPHTDLWCLSHDSKDRTRIWVRLRIDPENSASDICKLVITVPCKSVPVVQRRDIHKIPTPLVTSNSSMLTRIMPDGSLTLRVRNPSQEWYTSGLMDACTTGGCSQWYRSQASLARRWSPLLL